ncbi:unnamed protein product [Urochloa humidicola]
MATRQVGASALIRLFAPIDVDVPPGNTGHPSQTSLFQKCLVAVFLIGLENSYELCPFFPCENHNKNTPSTITMKGVHIQEEESQSAINQF